MAGSRRAFGLGFVIPGWSGGPDLRCAIAHRGISRFRVRVFDAPRNDEVYLRNALDHFGCDAAVAAGFFRLLMMIVISGAISRGRTPLSGWWIAPDSCDCSARASSCSASTEEPWISFASSSSRPDGGLAATTKRIAAMAKLTAPRIAAAEIALQIWTS